MVFSPSNYKFYDPIRYFKANDPYYYEVDNIPLKQLQENCNFLKDQLEQVAQSVVTPNQTPEGQNLFGRSYLSELQPYVNGNDNIVRVRPGRFTARVNDAYNLDELQQISKTSGDNFWDVNSYNIKLVKDPLVSDVLSKFQTILAENALGMNGLFERAFTLPMQPGSVDDPLAALNSSGEAGYTQLNRYPWPTIYGNLIAHHGSNQNYILSDTNLLESEFIRRWRGVARTSVVDIPQELEITIPDFNASDFFYIDSQGNEVSVTGVQQRIDLVFIYTKPIDSSSTTILKNGTPLKITTPQLGIIKGAGIGIRRAPKTNDDEVVNGYMSRVSLADNDVDGKILPNASDYLLDSLGFSGIKGSFPSPDDLLNFSPLLSEKLQNDHIALIGQTVLPIAYVVVNANRSVDPDTNLPILISENIVDIRPFFRTTELSYNERAGIAAAVPPISISNPVATESYVGVQNRKIKVYVDSLITETSSTISEGAGLNIRTLKSGYIFGGLDYGPESTLINYALRNPGSVTVDSLASAKAYLRTNYGYPESIDIPTLPQWDPANWIPSVSPATASRMNDWLNFVTKEFGGGENLNEAMYADRPANRGQASVNGRVDPNSSGGGKYGFGKLFNVNGELIQTREEITTPAIYPFYRRLNSNTVKQRANIRFCYVKKTLRIRVPANSGITDIRVNSRLHNCVPLAMAQGGNDVGANQFTEVDRQSSVVSNLWTTYKKIDAETYEATIFVAWPVHQFHVGRQWDGNTEFIILPPDYRGTDTGLAATPNINGTDKKIHYAGFIVLNDDISSDPSDFKFVGGNYSSRNNSLRLGNEYGLCLYPTVTFDVIGVVGSALVDLSQSNQIIL